MNVSRLSDSATDTPAINSSSARMFRFGPTRKSCSGTARSPRTLTSFTSVPATRSGGIASPAGDAVPRLPPIVPRLRICGPPIVREASASAGSSSESAACIASPYVRPAPSHTVPFCLDQPWSSSTSFRLSSAAGRPRSKLSSIITSVPPWIGTASARSALMRSASSSVRGLSTSTATSVLGCRERIDKRMAVDLARRLAVARGDEPADVVVRGGRVLSVFTREWLEASVAIADGWIAGIGEYEGNETVDATGKHVVPGFMDAHMHLESSKLLPDEFARLVLPLGTTTVVADPHELANVLGTDGVHWLLDFCAELPLDVYFMASSSVPASRFESPRRALNEGDLQGLLRRRGVLGLAAMMNFPGVIAGDEHELTKLGLTGAAHVGAHAPGVV